MIQRYNAEFPTAVIRKDDSNRIKRFEMKRVLTTLGGEQIFQLSTQRAS